ncbi:MAG: ribonuclease III [Pseudomonadota bacterium]
MSIPKNLRFIMPDLARLQAQLGYEFATPGLLERALRHKSVGRDNNEQLEFLGDAVLGYLVGALLYGAGRALGEDAMSLMRAHLVRGSALAEHARALDLSRHLQLGAGERKSGGAQRDSILADAFEALVGAIHEDGGIEACRRFVTARFAPLIEQLEPDQLKDAKTRLQEWLQGRRYTLPQYRVEDTSGADHQRSYSVSCNVVDLELSVRATASSRRGAEQAAAALMLQALSGEEGFADEVSDSQVVEP